VDGQRFVGVQDASGEQDLLRDGLADQFGQSPGGAGGGEDSQAGSGLPIRTRGVPIRKSQA
jgi:hypothetical protein